METIAIFKQILTVKQLIALKMAFLAVSASGEIWIFENFSNKKVLKHQLGAGLDHKDRSIHIERACSL